MKKKKVLKFGGSSVGNAEAIKKVVEIVINERTTHTIPCIIISALQGVTNTLLSLAETAARGEKEYASRLTEVEEQHLRVLSSFSSSKNREEVQEKIQTLLRELEEILRGIFLLQELTPRSRDLVMSFGERLSVELVVAAFNAQGEEAMPLDAREVVVTDRSFGGAKVETEKSYRKIQEFFSSPETRSLAVVTGFIGSSETGETTTLGRGGSDLSGALFGAALTAEVIEIWTDVDGVLTADPRKVKKAFPLPSLSYEEALELSHFGAKVIYAPTMYPALEKKIPLLIKNTFSPTAPGTLICSSPESHGYGVTGISSIDKISFLLIEGSGMIGVAGTATRAFSSLARSRINIILITQASSEYTICIAVDPSHATLAKAALEEEFHLELQAKILKPVTVEKDLSVISVVGDGMKHRPGISGTLFHVLGKNGVNVVGIAQGSSERNISVVIQEKDEQKALNAVHDAFFLSNTRTLHLYLIGTGLIGKTLLRQLASHAETLRNDHGIEIQLNGIVNRSGHLLSSEGISYSSWENELKNSPAISTEKFISSIIQMNLSNSVFVDCTASNELSKWYKPLLESHISVITPNKKAQSGSYSEYAALRLASRKPGTTFLYETSVGAGLPIINTLNDLIKSGDKILSIEAVLSGTLSFIFNTISSEQSMSKVVFDARKKGYTEPDPREDLRGTDVARKILILARESGLSLELSEVEVESLVPAELDQGSSVEEFLTKLPVYDSLIEERRAEAARNDKRLIYSASCKDGQASCKVEAVGRDHPFYNLSGSDNIVAFTTERYRERPLVIRGPGAGAEVTAAGVLADIVRVANYGI